MAQPKEIIKMKEYPETENESNDEDFEMDYETIARLRRRAQIQARTQANIVDGDSVLSQEDEKE
jgi:hypothetical protein